MMLNSKKFYTNEYGDRVFVVTNRVTGAKKKLFACSKGVWYEAPAPALSAEYLLDEWFHYIHYKQ